MKQVIVASLLLCCVAVRGQTAWIEGSQGSGRATLTIQPDGTSEVRAEGVQPRQSVERWVRAMARISSAVDDEEDMGEDVPPAADTPLSDKQLEEKLLQFTGNSDSPLAPTWEIKVESEGEQARITTRQSFKNLDGLVSAAPDIWQRAGLPVQNVRLEASNNVVRLTMRPVANSTQSRYLRRMLRNSTVTNELMIVVPGSIVSTDLAQVSSNAVRFVLNTKDADSLSAAEKLGEQPFTLAFEAGGLDVKRPLESRILARSVRESADGYAALPLSDAVVSYEAEAVGLMISTVHLFPGASNNARALRQFDALDRGSVTVTAKLFAPRGRFILRASDVRAVRAVDDKQRPVLPHEAEESSSMASWDSSKSERQTSIEVSLRLSMPLPDAEGIEELECEAIAVTAGSWKQMFITNIVASSNAMDLHHVLPDATMTIREASFKSGQVRVVATLSGPPEVKQVSVNVENPDAEHFSAHSYETGSQKGSGTNSRTITIQGFSFGQGEMQPGRFRLNVQIPADLKRERARFQLKGLDFL